MSDRTMFWLGSLMLALAIGLLVGSLVLPPSYGQAVLGQAGGRGEGRTFKYALVTGISGNAPKTETLYVADSANDMLFVFEYSSRSRDIEFRNVVDVRKHATELIKLRDKREREEK